MLTNQREHDTNTSAHECKESALTNTDDQENDGADAYSDAESGLFMQKFLAVLIILACCGFLALMVTWPAINAFRGLFGY